MKKIGKNALVAIGLGAIAVWDVCRRRIDSNDRESARVHESIGKLESDELRAECLKHHIDKRSQFRLGYNLKSGSIDLRC